ncbi:tyrosine phosphatase [Colletotrichum higginsianum IMI 349063]|uniref:Tyrosine phosphatase n=1 Tax=Colletotrichum higginsianum (strain IMI 349063) TaxID=759273 RepID=A0A1B7Y7A1_COLHI|nr:tyrosine phosphatase [Colletotrichum higginsianum IMI 349063]OBR07788.1 tyrosine phosphatase [Colletotrichum higginsianum IMI 349063]
MCCCKHCHRHPSFPPLRWVNIRDLGSVAGSAICPESIYRCGTLEAATEDPEAFEWLATKVKPIFDIRSPRERKHHPAPKFKGVANSQFNSTAFDA